MLRSLGLRFRDVWRLGLVDVMTLSAFVSCLVSLSLSFVSSLHLSLVSCLLSLVYLWSISGLLHKMSSRKSNPRIVYTQV